jgi:hypothetical protein
MPMRKNSVTDYATAAFALYFKYGCRGSEELREYLYHRELLKYDQPEIAVKRAETVATEYASLISDVAAVEKTLGLFKQCGDSARYKAVELVYLQGGANNRKAISLRVRRAALTIPASERTIYRWLREARTVFAEFRGLTIS